MQENKNLNVQLELKQKQALGLEIGSGSSVGTKDYEKLRNHPSINGVELIGNNTVYDLSIVSENTSEGWATMKSYIPKKGEIVIYRDNDSADIKIGDGVVPISDLPFVGQSSTNAVMEALKSHMDDPIAHITQAERDFWNAKLNYDISDSELILTRN